MMGTAQLQTAAARPLNTPARSAQQ